LTPQRKISQYAQVAAELRDLILSGQLPADAPLPSEDRLATRHGVSRPTLRAALAVLRAEGLITTVRGGASYVRDRRAVRLRLSQYGRTLHPGPPGPFTAAARDVGLVGTVHVVRVERSRADSDTARQLGITEGDEVIVRVRHMRLGEQEPETAQISTSTIPVALVEGSPLAAEAATRVYASFVELGIVPTTMTEEVSARTPTSEEAATLSLVPGQPVLVIERVTSDQEGRPIELVRTVATADRTVLVYDGLPITPTVS
jgi:GntR family transcriptional regulator